MKDKIEQILKEYVPIDAQAISGNIQRILEEKKTNSAEKEYIKILNCIDLTSLNTEDNEEKIADLVHKVNTFSEVYPELPNVAGICIYPKFIKTVQDVLTENVEIVSVCGGFPHSQTFMEVKIAETSLAILDGATEIDVVIPVGSLLGKKYEEVVEEIQEIKSVCKALTLKVILESGTLSPENIQIASILSMESGADFIKTSTGKQLPAATKEAAYIMAETIKSYHEKTGKKVGIKIAGGITTPEEALEYYRIVESILGEEWLNPQLLRFGASKLTNKLLSRLTQQETTFF
jgi:deoxyribose-phosphate aldolase